MPKGHKPKVPFEKGNKFGKGRPKVPEDLKIARKLNKVELDSILNGLIFLPRQDVVNICRRPDTPMIVKMLGRICLYAEKNGDQWRTTFILDRLIGKVPDKIEADVLHLVEQVKYLRELPKEELLKLTEDAIDNLKDRKIDQNS